ncbi:patellin-4 [Olea europaea subsp. europaea]|uniref:Patellin-4 n=1 Tax=Olea europaea subsp. europaea TaxID=158383 RepID=A0A8S0U0Q8_OLEEU|nr:patellin-4 [Olea europaea subsp. europaea]
MAVEGKESGVIKDQVETSREPKKSENVEEKAVTVTEDGKVAEAIKDLEKDDEPKQSENVEEKGISLIEDGTVAEAIKDLQKVDEPKQSENVEEKGVALIEDGKVAGAIKELEKVASPKGEENKNGSENVESSPSASDGNGKEVRKKKEKGECSSSSPDGKGGESSLISEENGLYSDLKGYEKKALTELRSKIEEAILTNKLFKGKKEEKPVQKEKLDKENEDSVKDKEKGEEDVEGGNIVDKGKSKVEDDEEKSDEAKSVEKEVEINHNISLWGIQLLPSKGDKGTDILLLKFLTAREFKVNDAFEMLKNTLKWRKENKIDSIMEEDFGNEYDTMAYTRGLDREGHMVCYNVYGVFANDEIYDKTIGTEAARERFLRWRFQLMEKQIQKLDFKPSGVSSLLQINDLKNTPGPSRKDLRLATKRAVGILQDNYPELVARNVFINVPFWYYAFNALLSPFLTQRTKSKFVFSRPARVTETLLKYIGAEQIPVHYGGLRKENDPNFSTKDAASEISVKAGVTETIEIPAPEVGNTLMWDLTIVGWDVNYKEEFVPTDEGSYTIIVKKGRKISWQDDSIRNSFRNSEPGKIVITVENGIFKKKRVLYRYKTTSTAAA